MARQQKIKVLEVIRQGKIGGGESHVLDLVASLDKSKFDVSVLSFTGGQMIQALEEMGIPAHVIASEKAFDLAVWHKVKTLIRKEQVDIVHVHGTRANTNILWAARSLRIPVIYTIHGWSFHEGLHPLMKKARIAAEKFITRRVQMNICVSDSNKQTGLDAFGRFHAVVIKNGVNLRKFDPAGHYPDVKAAYGIPAERLVIAYVARMTYQKDPVSMIRSFAKALEKEPAMTLLMIGEGELKQAAMDAVQELGITGNVIFDRFRQDVPAVLHAADIYCLPSLWEGFPIGVLEAMAMGKAVVASDVDGTREAVENDVNGLLVPAGNTEAVAAAITRLAKDRTLRMRLQQRAISTIQSTFDVAGVTRRIENIYEQLSEK